MKIRNIFIIVLSLFIALIVFLNVEHPSDLPVVAIANYGPHSSLDAAIIGTKEALEKEGFIENKTIKYEIADVGFDTSLIPQMITKLKNHNPKVIVVMGTPIAQFAKGAIKDTPLVFNVITDPVAAGLIKEAHAADGNMTGSSDQQNLQIMLQFAKKIIPEAKTVGLLYATAEANDLALLKMMKQAAAAEGMQVMAIPIDQPRDVPMRMQNFNHKVDFIYVGTSGAIQPTLPAIAAGAAKMNIPVFNADEPAVEKGMVLASFGVDYRQVGMNAGNIVVEILRGEPVSSIEPVYPSASSHHGFINKRQADQLGIDIPEHLDNLTIVE